MWGGLWRYDRLMRHSSARLCALGSCGGLMSESRIIYMVNSSVCSQDVSRPEPGILCLIPGAHLPVSIPAGRRHVPGMGLGGGRYRKL